MPVRFRQIQRILPRISAILKDIRKRPRSPPRRIEPLFRRDARKPVRRPRRRQERVRSTWNRLEPPTMPARTPRYAAAPLFRVRDGLWAAGKSPSSRTGAQAPYRGTHRRRGSTQAVWALHADLVAAGLDRLLDIGGDAVFQLREEPVLPGDRQCQQAKVLDDVRRVGQMPILLNSTGSTAAARHRTKRLVQPGFCRVRQKQDADMGRSVLARATVSFC